MKCPKCNMSDKVHSINIGRRFLGSILYAGAGILTAGRGVSVMRDAY